VAFIQDAVESGVSSTPTGGLATRLWSATDTNTPSRYFQRHRKPPSELLPHVHPVVSLLTRWLLGTHQGAVTHEHLDYYLDEFTFRSIARRSRSRGTLFFDS